MKTTTSSCPCKNCEKRHEHCHSKCAEYKAFKEERERIKRKRWLDALVPYGCYSSSQKKTKTYHKRHFNENEYD